MGRHVSHQNASTLSDTERLQTAGHVFTEIEFLLREKTQKRYLKFMTLSLRLGGIAKNLLFFQIF